MRDDVSAWLSTWFAKRSPEILLSQTDNFFEREAIDSFGVVELIEDIEQHFAIGFVETDYQDRRFPTIGGLSEIILARKTNAAI